MESGMYIRLTKADYSIIQNDIELFRSSCAGKNPADRQRYSANGFMNIVFANMADGSRFDEQKFPRKRYKDPVGMNIKLNKRIDRIMLKAGLDASDFGTHSADCAAYYMHFIESYCRLPLVERERIFYKPIIESIEDDICLHYYLKIVRNDGNCVNLLPFTVKSSDDIHKNYVVGFALRRTQKGYVFQKTVCVPLRKIAGVSHLKKIVPEKQIIFRSGSGITSFAELKSAINERLETDGVLYLSGKLNDVSVWLSDTGIKKLGELSLFRPAFEQDEKDGHIIRFRATWLQTFKYFFQFGSDAKILEPEEYRSKFRNSYKAAFELYS